MITMRANTTKVTKPPPPVPPRPSKNVVAEALAKSRHPPPAPPPNVVVKSQSYTAVNKYAPNYVEDVERPKPATRTLIYQSSNIKQRVSSIEEIRVHVNRKESIKRDGGGGVPLISRTSSFKAAPKPVADDRDSSLESLGESEPPISRSNSFKEADGNNSSDSVISEDEGNWHDGSDTTDRNHVNTLIDEMFASVLEPPDKCEPVLAHVINDNSASPPPAPPCDKVTIRTSYKATECHRDDAHDSEPRDSKKTIVVIEAESKNSAPVVNHRAPPPPPQPRRVIDDKFNHELLISELSNMKRERQICKRQRKPSEDGSVVSSASSPSSESKIQHSDWVEVNDGKEIRLSSCQITIADDDDDEEAAKRTHDIISRLEMANLHGLPPLPKSLSGFNIDGPPSQQTSLNRSTTNRSSTPKSASSSNGDLGGSLKKTNNLDAKLALLRREMYSLRQLDLSLLSQLWSLNESIQDFRHMLQEQDERNVLSPPSPSPTTSSGEDVDGEDFFQPSPMRFRLAPPPPPPHRRTSNSSSGTGSSV